LNIQNTRIFKDSPGPDQLPKTISRWSLPDLPYELKDRVTRFRRNWFRELSTFYQSKLKLPENKKSRHKVEITIINWLYDFVRLNIKRGRDFNLSEVLQTGEADCLGYSKIFTHLGRLCGLNLGVVEIITDCLGRNVPHTATLVNLSGGKKRIIDFWYGSKNIRHKRLGLLVKNHGIWKIDDLDYSDIRHVEDVSHLPDVQVDAITLYIEGNRALNEVNYTLAVNLYTQAANIFPENSRIYFNRAVCYEKMGKNRKSKSDYTLALGNDKALKRTLATQPQDVIDLIQLDHQFIPEIDQKIFLLHNGYITGRKESPENIGRKTSFAPEEVKAVLKLVDNLLHI
jgi:tetratricopeptide (TPR) repeat protein